MDYIAKYCNRMEGRGALEYGETEIAAIQKLWLAPDLPELKTQPFDQWRLEKEKGERR